MRHLRVTVDGHAYNVTVEDLLDTENQLYPQPGTMAAARAAEPVAAGPAPGPAGPAGPAVGSAAGESADPAGPAGVAAPAGGRVVTAQMSGVVQEILVSVGQQVQSGDTVASIEAMKMKTPVVSNHAGTVASVEVAVGDPVQSGQILLTLG